MTEALYERAELFISARNLVNRDTFSKSDPFAVLFAKADNGSYVEVGRTNVMTDNLNPDWSNQFVVDYHFESIQEFKVSVYDEDAHGVADLHRHDLLGEATFKLANLMCARGQYMQLELVGGRRASNGQVIVKAESVANVRDKLRVQFRAERLVNKDGLFGKSDPFLVGYKLREDNSWLPVWKSEVIDNNLSPTWGIAEIPIQKLCNGDLDRPVKFEIFDYDNKDSAMAFATINYHGHSLKKASSFNIIFPDDPAIPGPWGAFYLLHGLSDDHTIWMRRTSIERYVAGLPLVVVMPDGGRGWYTNSADGLTPYEDDLIEDVIGLVDRTFPVKAEARRAIGGLSMGGYGAVKLALKYPEMFASASSHSGALAFPRININISKNQSPEASRIFGDSARGGPDDPFALVERIDHGRVPALRIDCGKEDFLLAQNREFHAHLDQLHVPHEYEEYPGTHNWEYWDLHVREALAFHVRNLGLAKK